MGEITYSNYLETDVCKNPECGWFGKDILGLKWICPECGTDTNLRTGRFIYESYKPTTIKEKLLHAIFKETKKLIDFKIKGEKNG